MSFVRPCKVILNLHILHANTMTYLKERSSIVQVNEPVLSECGWDHRENFFRIKEAYPSSLESLLVVIAILKAMKKTWTSISKNIAWLMKMILQRHLTPYIYKQNFYSRLTFSLRYNFDPVFSTTFAGLFFHSLAAHTKPTVLDNHPYKYSKRLNLIKPLSWSFFKKQKTTGSYSISKAFPKCYFWAYHHLQPRKQNRLNNY